MTFVIETPVTEDETPSSSVEPCSLQAPSALGHLVLLSMRSSVHHRWAVDDFAANFLPPIGYGQIQLYHAGRQIVGALTWAWLDAATETKLLGRWPGSTARGLAGW